MRYLTILLLASSLPLTTQDSPTIKVTKRMLQVNMVDRDKKGPVADLKKEDFTLLEHGKPRDIAAFSIASNATSQLQNVPKLPPNVFSNMIDRSATASNNITVVLLDGLNTPITDQAYARQQVIKFLDSLQREDRISLYVLGSSLKVLHDFTSDYDSLRASIARSKGVNMGHLDASTPDESNSGSDALDEFLNSANQKIADFYTIDRVRRTTQAMELIARHVSSIPGRKNLIWVSGSFPFSIGMDSIGGTNEHRTFNEEIGHATRRLNESNIAVYPVDARGLVVGPRQPSAAVRGLPPQRTNLRSIFPVPVTGLDTMEELASRTGGRAFYNTNDIKGAIHKAMEDAEVTYTLGFYPASGELDGKFHDLKVKVARSGVDVRHRKGYLAIDAPVRTDKQMLDEMRVTALAPLDLTELAVSSRLDVVNDPKPGTLRLTMLLDAHDFTLEKQNGKWTGKGTLMLVQLGLDQKILFAYNEPFDMQLTDENYAKVLKQGILITKQMEPAKGVQQIRVVYLDRVSSKIGSLRIPVNATTTAPPATPTPAPATPDAAKR